MESINWTWGLSLIALTTAIHTMGVVMMALAGIKIRAALEAADGMLLFGISTAYIFAVMQVYWPMLAKPFTTRPHPQ